MGSGLVLLLIVGAWLAVLVPMFVRRHDAGSTVHSVYRFNDAMRVLSRRSAPDRRAVLVPRPAGAPALVPDLVRHSSRVPQGPTFPPTPAAVRRRRVLTVLVAVAVVFMASWAAAGSGALLLGSVLVDLLVIGWVAYCRRQVKVTALRKRRAAARASRGARPLRTQARRRVEPAPVVAAPAQRSDVPVEPVVAPQRDRRDRPAAAVGAEWSPVPVPKPTYATAPAAPGRRVVDLTRPGEWSEALRAGEDDEALLESGPDLDTILTARRAVND